MNKNYEWTDADATKRSVTVTMRMSRKEVSLMDEVIGKLNENRGRYYQLVRADVISDMFGMFDPSINYLTETIARLQGKTEWQSKQLKPEDKRTMIIQALAYHIAGIENATGKKVDQESEADNV